MWIETHQKCAGYADSSYLKGSPIQNAPSVDLHVVEGPFWLLADGQPIKLETSIEICHNSKIGFCWKLSTRKDLPKAPFLIANHPEIRVVADVEISLSLTGRYRNVPKQLFPFRYVAAVHADNSDGILILQRRWRKLLRLECVLKLIGTQWMELPSSGELRAIAMPSTVMGSYAVRPVSDTRST